MRARLPELAQPVAGCGRVGVVAEDRADIAEGRHGGFGRFVGADGESFFVSPWRMTAVMGERGFVAPGTPPAKGREARGWSDPDDLDRSSDSSVRVLWVARACAAR